MSMDTLLLSFINALDTWRTSPDIEQALIIANNLDLAKMEFLQNEMDPFDERPPSIIIPKCVFGTMLESLLEDETFFESVCNDFILNANDEKLPEIGCRLLLNLLFSLGLKAKIKEFGETLVLKLYEYAQSDTNETLKYCSIGIIGFIMKIPGMTTTYEEENLQLIPELLSDLHQIKMESIFSRNSLNDCDENNFPFAKKCEILHYLPLSNLQNRQPNSIIVNDVNRNTMSSMRENFKESCALQYLASTCEYPEIAQIGCEKNVVSLIYHYLEPDVEKNANIKFRALKYLASLIFHRKIATVFITLGGFDKLVTISRSSSVNYGISWFLCCFASNNSLMEIMKHQPLNTKKEMVSFALWAGEHSQASCSHYAIIFLKHIMKYKYFLDEFDQLDGLSAIVGILLRSMTFFSDSTFNKNDIDGLKKIQQRVKGICDTLQSYFEAHIVFKSVELQHQNSISDINKKMSGEAQINFKTIQESIEYLLKMFPMIENWKPLHSFIEINGIYLLLKVIYIYSHYMFSSEERTLKSIMNVLMICSIMPKVQQQLCETMQILIAAISKNVVGIKLVLEAASGSLISNINVRIPALFILINCICKEYPSRTRYEEIYFKKLFDSIRKHDGLMIFLKLLKIQKPLTEADYIRALSCKILCGLIECDIFKQIVSKQCLVTAEHLKKLMKEPILYRKQRHHSQFYKHSKELIEKALRSPSDSINTNNIINSTKMVFNQRQLLYLIHQHLIDNNYELSASILRKEAHLSLCDVGNNSNKSNLGYSSSEMICLSNNDHRITLNSIIKNYLLEQHSCCTNPIAICAPFDLSKIHQCPEPKNKDLPPINIVSEVLSREIGGKCKNQNNKLLRNFTYSRFKPIKNFKAINEDGDFTCCSISKKMDYVLVGTKNGYIKVFDITEEMLENNSFECHTHAITYFEESKNEKLLLTSSRDNTSGLWSFESNFDRLYSFNDSYSEFSKMSDTYVIGTTNSIAHVYDISTLQLILTFEDELFSNKYFQNKATFNPTDQLILSDGILWDVRRKEKVHKFDKFNTAINGIFHPSKLEIISNTEIWDLRTYDLIKTVPSLNQCQICFNSNLDMLYAASKDKPLFNMDSTDYTIISTINADKIIVAFSIDVSEEFATTIEKTTVENDLETVCSVYEVGKCGDTFGMEEKIEKLLYSSNKTYLENDYESDNGEEIEDNNSSEDENCIIM